MVKEFCGRAAHAWTNPTANSGDMLATNGPAIAPIEEVGLMHMIVAMAQVDLRCAVSSAGQIKKAFDSDDHPNCRGTRVVVLS